ncbi:hypothetical protein [Pandoraea oxalativorans]|uniref:Uncharacterized protein n=1 Tax=Pandoraea oxalativorans TaxID=573737 RepID=A0A0E3U5Y5_9BURK|nr:hypothetical protein [Pandoraea oxalativorans]AKC69013.1 hypothetical protein MB84_05330 [Pandoraea oxalativorans]
MNTVEGVSTISPMSADVGNEPIPMSLAERIRGMRGASPGQPLVSDIDAPSPDVGTHEDNKDKGLPNSWRKLFVRQLWLASFDASQEQAEEIGDV